MFFVENANALLIGALGIDVVLAFPINLGKPQQKHGFANAVTRTLFHTLFVGTDALQRVAGCKVDIADGVIDLIQIVLILVALGHTL